MLKSGYFKKIEKYSNSFIRKVGKDINSYNNKWVYDPLHQWSRQWEYVYIINRLESINLDKNATILDLGAGMSFLPYYLKDKLGLKNITAIDYDRGLSDLYTKVNKKLNIKVPFNYGDIRDLKKVPSNHADIIYSVSVLEHTDNYRQILKEILRILKPNGRLIFTFDISIDGLDDIPIKKAKLLLKTTSKVFNDNTIDHKEIEKIKDWQGYITSREMAKIDKKLMPWKIPVLNVIKPIIKTGKVGSLYKNLTFYCLTVEK